jgi:hypothetical protein
MGELLFRVHAIRHMFERAVSVEEIKRLLDTGEVIQTYPDDKPYPSRLVLGWRDLRPLHIVAAYDEGSDTTFVITVYEPDPTLWEPGFRRKRR